MAIIVSTTLEISFRAADFLLEAIDDFLESGTSPRKIGSSIIKIAVGTELLLKEKLEKICPALILEDVGKRGVQVAKVYELGKQMRQPKLLDEVELRTAPMGELLNRAELFFTMGRGRKHLEELQKLRNKLVHHSVKLDMNEANLLIINKIVPFVQHFTKDDLELQVKVAPQTWKRLRAIANTSTHVIYAQFAKRVQKYTAQVRDMDNTTASERASALPNLRGHDTILGDNLLCPACRWPAMTALCSFGTSSRVDDVSKYYDAGAICKVCDFRLDEEDVELYLEHWKTIHGGKHELEKRFWRRVFPGYPDVILPPINRAVE